MSLPLPEYATLTSDDLVTGEAVALDLPAASFGSRIASGLIDILATVATAFALVLLLSVVLVQADEALAETAIILTMIALFLGVPTAVETLTRGRSLGKLALGLRTVRDDAGPISFQHAFIRSLIGFIEVYVFSGVPAFFSALLSDRGKRLGDHAAGTYVIRERFTLALPPPAQMPYPLQHWARSADIAPLPVPVALAVRQFLSRAHQLTPDSRAALSIRLTEQVQPFVSPAPPPGTPPEAFLTAVLVSRRDRDLARLHRESELRQRLFSRG
ncbi:MAG: RDD family protein [Marmoricola sp.]